MDPDEALRIIREAIAALREPEEDSDAAWGTVAALVESVEGLDQWLSRGGFVPEAWGPRGDVQVTIEILADGTVTTRPPFRPSDQLPDLPSLLRFLAEHVQPGVTP